MQGAFKLVIAILAVIVIVVVLAALWFVCGSLIGSMTMEPALAFLYVARLAMLVFGVFFVALLLLKINSGDA